jgi:hypothetical protein
LRAFRRRRPAAPRRAAAVMTTPVRLNIYDLLDINRVRRQPR